MVPVGAGSNADQAGRDADVGRSAGLARPGAIAVYPGPALG